MLLTLTTTVAPANDLGYLLAKNPARMQSFDLAFGKAHVFYTEASAERCTAALLLEVDPVGLVRGRRGPAGEGGALEQYVNDRPYVASSFLSVAIAQVFGSALGGRSKDRPELAQQAIPLEARISVLPCRGGEQFLRSLFEPLGYAVTALQHPLDETAAVPDQSRYFTVELRATKRLSELLAHLYVLVPVLDDDKHYWVGDDEVEKLLRHGEGWLETHPEREAIARRYLAHQKSLARAALDRLVIEEDPAEAADEPVRAEREAEIERPLSLDEQRRGAVVAVLKEAGAARVLGDLVDRGPSVATVLRIVMSMEKAGTALCVPGNHEMKLMRKLRGKDVKLTHGLAQTMEQLEREPPEFKQEVATFIDDLVSHYVLDEGKLVVAHAGMKEVLQGRGSGKVREFALYGETTGETDEYGLPVRYPWASEYRGKAAVVYGHTPVPEAEWLNNTICIDTGCVYGGKLTALRWPERELKHVAAAQMYCEPIKPLVAVATPATLSAQHANDDVLDLADVFGKRIIETRLQRNVTIREENSSAALEVMSRFAANPRWLVYLPPTMSPPETSRRPGLLEHPDEAFAYFRREGVVRVVCEEKHMGSRAVVIACKDAEVAKARFGVATGEVGVGGHPHGTPLLQRRGYRSRVHGPRPQRAGSQQLLGGTRDWLGAARLRADALVGQGPGSHPRPVRGSGRGVARSAARRLACAGSCGGTRRGDGQAPATHPRACGIVHTVCRGISPLLLAGALSGRPQARALPPASDRGGCPHQEDPRLAPAGAGKGLRGGLEDAARDPVPRGRARRCRRRERSGPLVGRTHLAWRRRHGGEAPRLHRAWLAGPCPASGEMQRA